MTNCRDLDLQGLCAYLLAHDDYVILTHTSPDGDTLGAGYALCALLRRLSKRANVKCPDTIPAKFGYFTDKLESDNSAEKTIVAVDIADEKLLGSLEQEYGGRVMLNIDHHISNKGFAENRYLDTRAAAVCECIYDLALALNVELDKFALEAIYTGLATDCGCFKYSNTTPKTHRIAAALIEAGVDAFEINRIMFDTKSKARLAIEKAALESMEFFCKDKAVLLAVTKDMIKTSGCAPDDLDGLSAIARCAEGIKISATMSEKENGDFKISVRSFDGYDASELCRKFGGGGHKAAAGCTISDTYENARAKLMNAICEVLE